MLRNFQNADERIQRIFQLKLSFLQNFCDKTYLHGFIIYNDYSTFFQHMRKFGTLNCI